MRKPDRARRGIAAEALEGRVLLSSTGQSPFHPTYRVFRSLGTMAPDTSGPISPAQMAQAYGVNSIRFGSVAGDGSGQTIALIDAFDDPTAASDLADFDSKFGLPDPPSFQKLDQNGGTNFPQSSDTWLTEEALDVQWAHVIAPKANLILYEANTDSDADLIQAAVNTARNNPSVTAISMSFGGGEFSSETDEDGLFTSSHATFFASTGDTGAPGGYPAYSPNVVAVGGTTLNIDSSGNYLSETGWGDSGGGTSAVEPEPSYQMPFQNTGSRTIPDVAIDADPATGVQVDIRGNLSQVGGTSLSAPMWAGLIAIANQGRAINGLAPLGSSQTLPMLYQSAASNFHDITTGSNGANGMFDAGPGYDEVTGRGSPIANLLIPYLAGTTPTVTAFSGSPNPVAPGANVTLAATVTDPDAAVSSVGFYRETNGTAGLQTGAGGDTLLGTDTNGADGWSLSTSTTGLSGNVTYYAVPTDASGVTGLAASTTVAVISASTPPTLVGAPVINGDDPNGLFTAAGQGTNGKQRSMVEDIVYTFNEPVTITDANAAFTVAAPGPAGGTVPTTLFAQAVAGSNGTQWAVSLTGKAEGTLASIANGEYSIQINPAGVFAAADGTTAMAAGTGRTDNFFRLFGDIDGNESVSTLDYGRFKQALNGAYNPAFDYDGNGSISTLDYGRFKQDMPISYFNDGFVTTI
jgi:hypothetical protein